jgi:hypothetical protein
VERRRAKWWGRTELRSLLFIIHGSCMHDIHIYPECTVTEPQIWQLFQVQESESECGVELNPGPRGEVYLQISYGE